MGRGEKGPEEEQTHRSKYKRRSKIVRVRTVGKLLRGTMKNESGKEVSSL